MTDLAQLIADLESAQVGSLHYDKRILAALGFTWRGMAYWNSQEQWKGSAALTRSMDAAVALIELRLPCARWEAVTTGFKPGASIVDARGVWQAGSYAETAPLALCIAFLRALQAQQETSEDE